MPAGPELTTAGGHNGDADGDGDGDGHGHGDGDGDGDGEVGSTLALQAVGPRVLLPRADFLLSVQYADPGI